MINKKTFEIEHNLDTCQPCEKLRILQHKIFVGEYELLNMAFKQYIKINIQQFDQSSKCFFTVIPIDSVNIRHLIKYSFAGGISEREHFYNTIIEYCCNHNKGNYTTYDEILCFFEKNLRNLEGF